MDDFDVHALNERLGDLCKIFSERWNDEYFLSLGIFDHIHEVGVLIDKWKSNKNSENFQLLNKELMDLFVLLLLWHKDEKFLFNERLDKFLSHCKLTKSNPEKTPPDIIELMKNPQVLHAITGVYGDQKMNEYIESGFLDLCLQQRRIRITEQMVQDDERKEKV